MNLLATLRDRFAAALRGLVDDPTRYLDQIRPAQDPKFGDYQANMALPLKNVLQQPPREIAERIVAQLDVADLCAAPEVAGPGFINLRLQDRWLAEQAAAMARDERLGVPEVSEPRTYVLDFSSPNVAKPMHVGHIRSTVIGDALARTLRLQGHTVITDNHLGDWGTQFGMIIYGYRHFGDPAAYEKHPVGELSRVYRVVRRAMDCLDSRDELPQLEAKVEALQAAAATLEQSPPADDPKERKKADKALKKARAATAEADKDLKQLREKLKGFAADETFLRLLDKHAQIRQAVLEETAKLHAGDAENLKLWEEFLPHCQADLKKIYDRLGVSFDYELGESFYHDRLPRVVEDLESRGLARESDGATCVFLEGFDAPMIIRKKDGAFLYSTTDLATIQYRMEQWRPDAILYVVDFRQGEHFDKLFAAARLWGYGNVELKHVEFGTVTGKDGKPFKTRAGDTVGLSWLLDEAVAKARQLVNETDDKNPAGPQLDDAQRAATAEAIGIGAIKYADLSHHRASDYKFDLDEMTALAGDTGPYLQYSIARVHGIFRKGGVDPATLSTDGPLMLSEPTERTLAVKLLRFAETLDDVVADYRPNLMTSYLYDLTKSFFDFYEACPVLKADEPTRTSRLRLCDLVRRVVSQGLGLLGIGVVERM